MPFREKSAWINFIGQLLFLVLFFGSMVLGLVPPHGMGSFMLFVKLLLAFVVMQIVLNIIAAALAPKEANAPADEREQLIGLKATRNAYVVLVIGILLVPVSMHLGFRAPAMGYLAFAGLLTAGVIREGSRVTYYRLGR